MSNKIPAWFAKWQIKQVYLCFAWASKVLKITKIRQLNIPRHTELSIKSFWKHIKKTPLYLQYFQDSKDSQLRKRTFMFNLLYTIDSSFVKDKVIMSNEYRKSVMKMDEVSILRSRKNYSKKFRILAYYQVSTNSSYKFRNKR